MKLRLYLNASLILVGLSLAVPAGADLTSEVPRSAASLVVNDGLYNVYDRQEELLSEHDRRVQPAYHWDVPETEVTQYESKFGLIGRNVAHIEHEGRKYVRIFAVDEPFIDLKGLIKKFGQPEQRYLAVRMQSKATYFIWDPKNPGAETFFAKMQRSWPDWRAKTKNTEKKLRNAVLSNDTLEDLIRIGSPQMADAGSFFPERLAVGISDKSGFSYAMSIRSAEPLGGLFDRLSALYPAHAVLGSPIAEKFAALSGKSSSEWLNDEYYPALARFLAKMNVGLGVFLEAHTQNLVLDVNTHTGRINKIDYRDLGDTMFDPVTIALQKLPFDTRPERLPENVLNENWESVGQGKARYPGAHFRGYSKQSVTSFLGYKNLKDRHRTLGAFFESYIAEAEKITGKPIILSKEAAKSLASLKSPSLLKHAHLKMQSESEYLDAILREQGEASELIMQDVYESITRERASALRKSLNFYPELHSLLRHTFVFKGMRWNIPHKNSFFKTMSQKVLDSRAEYAWDGKGIWMFDKKTGDLLAYGYGASNTLKAELDQAVHAAQASGAVSRSLEKTREEAPRGTCVRDRFAQAVKKLFKR